MGINPLLSRSRHPPGLHYFSARQLFNPVLSPQDNLLGLGGEMMHLPAIIFWLHAQAPPARKRESR